MKISDMFLGASLTAAIFTACQSKPTAVLVPEKEVPSIKTEVTATLPGEPTETDSSRLKVTDIYFDISSSRLSKENRSKLLKLNEVLKSNPGLYEKLEVVGHTDSTGPKSLNKQLSKKRALSVSEVMRDSGLSSTAVAETTAEAPQAPDSPKLRRVEIYLKGVRDESAAAEALKEIPSTQL